MIEDLENPEFFDELPDENFDNPDELIEQKVEDLIEPEQMDIPDVHWARDIERIQNPRLRQREIGAAEKILDKEKEINEKYERGEMTDYQFWEATQFGLRREKVQASTRSSLASVNLTYDDLGDLSEDWGHVVNRDLESMDRKERLIKTIDSIGPENAKELADEMHKEGKLSDNTHQSILRQVRLHKK